MQYFSHKLGVYKEFYLYLCGLNSDNTDKRHCF